MYVNVKGAYSSSSLPQLRESHHKLIHLEATGKATRGQHEDDVKTFDRLVMLHLRTLLTTQLFFDFTIAFNTMQPSL